MPPPERVFAEVGTLQVVGGNLLLYARVVTTFSTTSSASCGPPLCGRLGRRPPGTRIARHPQLAQHDRAVRTTRLLPSMESRGERKV
jgi:hypothetical protein